MSLYLWNCKKGTFIPFRVYFKFITKVFGWKIIIVVQVYLGAKEFVVDSKFINCKIDTNVSEFSYMYKGFTPIKLIK